MLDYFARIAPGKAVLWCYLIWYLVVVAMYFDPMPAIWLNSLGISLVIGIALNLSIGAGKPAQSDRWTIARMFLMPFCVSSFSSLIKGRGFILIAPPDAAGLAACVGACLLFVAFVALMKRLRPAT